MEKVGEEVGRSRRKSEKVIGTSRKQVGRRSNKCGTRAKKWDPRLLPKDNGMPRWRSELQPAATSWSPVHEQFSHKKNLFDLQWAHFQCCFCFLFFQTFLGDFDLQNLPFRRL